MARTEEPPQRLPKQDDGDGRHGVSGYAGNVEVYDPAASRAEVKAAGLAYAQTDTITAGDEADETAEKPKGTKSTKAK